MAFFSEQGFPHVHQKMRPPRFGCDCKIPIRKEFESDRVVTNEGIAFVDIHLAEESIMSETWYARLDTRYFNSNPET